MWGQITNGAKGISRQESDSKRWDKQGISATFLAGGGGTTAARLDSVWRSKFLHLAMRRDRRIAKVVHGAN
jgi:hypothetical protein